MTEGHENVLARIADEAYERATTAIRLMLAAQADNRVLRDGIATLKAERDTYKAALLNTRGDDICWISDVDQAKALPEDEFIASCRRFRAQIAADCGEFTGGKTIAQLELEVATLTQERDDSQKALAVIERLVGDDFCEDLQLRSEDIYRRSENRSGQIIRHIHGRAFDGKGAWRWRSLARSRAGSYQRSGDMPELSSATIRATVIAHTTRLGKCPAPGVVIDFRLQMQEIAESDLNAGNLDKATVLADHGRIWFTVTGDDIEAAKKLINDQAAVYSEPKLTKVWLKGQDG